MAVDKIVYAKLTDVNLSYYWPWIGPSCDLDQSFLFSSDTQDIKLVGLLLIPINSRTTSFTDVEGSSWTVQGCGPSSLWCVYSMTEIVSNE